MKRFFLPLLIFAALAVLLAAGLRLDPKRVPSPLIGKLAPPFSLPRLDDPAARVSPEDFRGQTWLLNVWASWCASCIEEHPHLLALAKRGDIAIVGLNYKDESAAAVAWLAKRGDPYGASALDADGAAGLDWGVYGVPETFVIDEGGVVRHKHIGPLSRADIEDTILPLLRELRKQ